MPKADRSIWRQAEAKGSSRSAAARSSGDGVIGQGQENRQMKRTPQEAAIQSTSTERLHGDIEERGSAWCKGGSRVRLNSWREARDRQRTIRASTEDFLRFGPSPDAQ